MSRRTAIVCESIHHGNTRRIAEAIAAVLDAELFATGTTPTATLAAYDLVGFGSGIYFGRHHRSLRTLVDSVPVLPRAAFLFSTAGLPWLSAWYHISLRRRLQRRGCRVLGEFCCAGWDTVGPLVLIGGLNWRRPNEGDLERAREFARFLVRSVPETRQRHGPCTTA